MAGGDAARRADRGGDRIPALRPSQPRLATSAAALVVLAALATYPVVAVDERKDVAAGIGAAALALLALALARRITALVPWPIALAGAGYAVMLALNADATDAAAPLYAAGLLLAAELAYWSLEARGVPEERGLLPLRVGVIAACCLGTIVVGGALMVAAAAGGRGGVALEAVGVAAAAAAVALVTWLARRQAAT